MTRLTIAKESILMDLIIMPEPSQNTRADGKSPGGGTVIQRLDILFCRGPRVGRVEEWRIEVQRHVYLQTEGLKTD